MDIISYSPRSGVEPSGDDNDIMSSVNSSSSAGVGNGTIYDNDEFADKLREGADVDSLSDDEARYLASLQATRELFRYSKTHPSCCPYNIYSSSYCFP